LKPCAGEQHSQNRVQANCGPQEFAGKSAAKTNVSEVQRGERVVRQHAAQRCSTGPTGNTQCDQGNASDTTHYHGDAGKFHPEQEPSDEGWNDQQRQAHGGLGKRP
jgi:hypothetical protein